MDTLYEYLFSESDFYKRIQKTRKTKGESDFVSRLCVFVLLCMGVCGERGSEGGDVGSSVCCLCFKLMLYEIILGKKMMKIKKKSEIQKRGNHNPRKACRRRWARERKVTRNTLSSFASFRIDLARGTWFLSQHCAWICWSEVTLEVALRLMTYSWIKLRLRTVPTNSKVFLPRFMVV